MATWVESYSLLQFTHVILNSFTLTFRLCSEHWGRYHIVSTRVVKIALLCSLSSRTSVARCSSKLALRCPGSAATLRRLQTRQKGVQQDHRQHAPILLLRDCVCALYSWDASRDLSCAHNLTFIESIIGSIVVPLQHRWSPWRKRSPTAAGTGAARHWPADARAQQNAWIIGRSNISKKPDQYLQKAACARGRCCWCWQPRRRLGLFGNCAGCGQRRCCRGPCL